LARSAIRSNSSRFDLPQKDEPPSNPTRLEEARRIIEQYANDLREITKKLRRFLKLN
jgi:hypothetical protein